MIIQPDKDNPWAALEHELQAWEQSGQCASLWWRDDDAAAAGPKLDQLTDLTSNTGLLLAVIPARAEHSLVSSLSGAPHVHVAQHGYAHINHAPRGRGLGAWELGMHRGMDMVLADLDRGRTQLEELFEASFLPIVVPPWNRIAPELLAPIAARGYSSVSAFGARDSKNPAPGLLVVNAHCDPIRWKTGAHFAGEIKTIVQLIEHLQARRSGSVDADEPTGFLTHHIDLDAAGWEFCTRLSKLIDEHSGARWVSPIDIFKATT